MELTDILRGEIMNWYEVDNLDRHGQEIQNILAQLQKRLDEYHHRWGLGFLQKTVSSETRDKWSRQVEKFSTALKEGRVDEINLLAQGCLRGYEAMEKEIIALGHEPLKNSENMTYTTRDGKTYIVCQHQDGARVVTARALGENVEVWTMAEVCQFIDKNLDR